MPLANQPEAKQNGAAYLDEQLGKFKEQFPKDFGSLSTTAARAAAQQWLSKCSHPVDLSAPVEDQNRTLIEKAAYCGLGVVEKQLRVKR